MNLVSTQNTISNLLLVEVVISNDKMQHLGTIWCECWIWISWDGGCKL